MRKVKKVEGFFDCKQDSCRSKQRRANLSLVVGGMSEDNLVGLFGKAPESFKLLLPKMLKDEKKSVGKFRPWAWWVEITRGCNLRCGFCATRLFPPGKFEFMSMDTWKQLIDVIKRVSPVCRLEIGNAGEPTLNPMILDFLRHARATCPTIQLMTYTNGTTLTDGRITYKELFEAGLNFVFVDMYVPTKLHIDLARSSGYEWVEQSRKPRGAVNIFQYQGDPDVHAIMLCQHPGNWPKRKVSRGAFSTFFNNLDWEAAFKYGLRPVTEPPARRCDMPFKYPNVYWDGSYTFCCFDFMRQVAGTLGNVSEGTDGFFRYWFGRYMQECRRLLHRKDRAGHPMCRKCSFTSIRCDIPCWGQALLEYWWDGSQWVELEPLG